MSAGPISKTKLSMARSFLSPYIIGLWAADGGFYRDLSAKRAPLNLYFRQGGFDSIDFVPPGNNGLRALRQNWKGTGTPQTTDALRGMTPFPVVIPSNAVFGLAVYFKILESDLAGAVFALRSSLSDNPIAGVMNGFDGANTNNGKFECLARDDSGSLTQKQGTYENTINDGLWHLAAVQRSGGNWQASLDGGAWTNFAGSSNNAQGAITFTYDDIGLGCEPNWIDANFANPDQRFMDGTIGWATIWQGYTMSNANILGLYKNPLQLINTPERRKLWFAPQAQVTTMIGGGSASFKALTEQATGIAGALGFGTDTLKALTESATGRTGALGFGTDTLKALTESGTGITGARGFGADTLKALLESATGTITSNNVTGGGSANLKALLESATGRAGALGFGTDSLKALTESGTGITGAVGFGTDTLKPLTETGTGISGAPPLAPSTGGFFGGQAWWGYESFDGSNRPWWYKDLKDKADELERLRKLRIELGILPKEESKAIAKTVREVKSFIQKTPAPDTADKAIQRAEELAARVEQLVDSLQEDDDEQAIMRMSKFFFKYREHRCAQ